MRRVAILVVLVALSGSLLAGSPAGARQTPKLRLVALSPLTIAGTAFRPRERTLVTATAGTESQTTRVVTTRLGAFRVILGQVTPSRCDLIRVVAVGRAGSRVVLKRLPAPACLPERSYG